MARGHHTRRAAASAALAAFALTVGGCVRQDAAAPVPAPSPPADTPAAVRRSEQPQSKAAHQATLNAQSSYWRRHGQGLNGLKNEPKPAAHRP